MGTQTEGKTARMPKTTVRGVVFWIYEIFTVMLVLTDFYRSSWLCSELLGTWQPSPDDVKLKSNAVGLENFENLMYRTIGLNGADQERMMRFIGTGSIYDKHYYLI